MIFLNIFFYLIGGFIIKGAYDSSKRIFYFDVLRTLAILFVILSHVCKTFAGNFKVGTFNWLVSISFTDIAVMGVPIFLMISGALLLGRDYTISDFMKRRFSRILIPFIFWALLLPICKMVFLGEAWTLTNYKELFFLKQYWFVWMLIGAYLLLPIMNSFIKEFELKGLAYLLIIWFIGMVFLREFSFYTIEKLFEMHPMGWKEIFAGYFGFFPLGYYLSIKKFKWSDSQMWKIGLGILFIFTAINFAHTMIDGPKDAAITYYGYRRIVSTLQCIGLFIFIKYFSQYCEENKDTFKNKIYSFFKDTPLSAIILSISICSYGIFLTHYFWLYLLRYVGHNVFPIFSTTPLLLPVVLVFIAVMSWATVIVFSKIPILKYFSGAH